MQRTTSKSMTTLGSAHPYTEGLHLLPEKKPPPTGPVPDLTVVKKENKDMDDKIREISNRIAYLLAQEEEMDRSIVQARLEKERLEAARTAKDHLTAESEQYLHAYLATGVRRGAPRPMSARSSSGAGEAPGTPGGAAAAGLGPGGIPALARAQPSPIKASSAGTIAQSVPQNPKPTAQGSIKRAPSNLGPVRAAGAAATASSNGEKPPPANPNQNPLTSASSRKLSTADPLGIKSAPPPRGGRPGQSDPGTADGGGSGAGAAASAPASRTASVSESTAAAAHSQSSGNLAQNTSTLGRAGSSGSKGGASLSETGTAASGGRPAGSGERAGASGEEGAAGASASASGAGPPASASGVGFSPAPPPGPRPPAGTKHRPPVGHGKPPSAPAAGPGHSIPTAPSSAASEARPPSVPPARPPVAAKSSIPPSPHRPPAPLPFHPNPRAPDAGEAVAVAFRLGGSGLDILAYGAMEGEDRERPGHAAAASDPGGASGSRAHPSGAGPAPPGGLVAALQRVGAGDGKGPKAKGSDGAEDTGPLSPESRVAFERMYAAFRRTADRDAGSRAGDEDDEEEEDSGGLSLAEVVGAAGMGFGRGLDLVFARWGEPSKDPLRAALADADKENDVRNRERAEERRVREEENRRRAREREKAMVTVEVGAGAWARKT